ncbi:MAG: hypothetical protein GY940_13525, partial [bacterium]|nr:hypothetical protein [bacterium]
GMKSRECNGGCQSAGWKSRDGKLWFPTIKGLVAVDPENANINRIPPPVVVEKIVGDEMEVDLRHPEYPNAAIKILPPGTERFEIKFTGLSFEVPKRVSFQYMLEGYDRQWRNAGDRRFVYYTKMSPGDYTFRVKASNSDGIWNETGASVAFYLKPYFSQTWWFSLLCGLVLAALVFVTFRWRVRRTRHREERLEQIVAQRTRELQKANEIAEAASQTKSAFLARMSHEIR